MFSHRIWIAGVLLIVAHYSQSFVILTANIEDVKKIARKFVSEPMAQQIADFIAMAAKQQQVPNKRTNELLDIVQRSLRTPEDKKVSRAYPKDLGKKFIPQVWSESASNLVPNVSAENEKNADNMENEERSVRKPSDNEAMSQRYRKPSKQRSAKAAAGPKLNRSPRKQKSAVQLRQKQGGSPSEKQNVYSQPSIQQSKHTDQYRPRLNQNQQQLEPVESQTKDEDGSLAEPVERNNPQLKRTEKKPRIQKSQKQQQKTYQNPYLSQQFKNDRSQNQYSQNQQQQDEKQELEITTERSQWPSSQYHDIVGLDKRDEATETSSYLKENPQKDYQNEDFKKIFMPEADQNEAEQKGEKREPDREESDSDQEEKEKEIKKYEFVASNQQKIPKSENNQKFAVKQNEFSEESTPKFSEIYPGFSLNRAKLTTEIDKNEFDHYDNIKTKTIVATSGPVHMKAPTDDVWWSKDLPRIRAVDAPPAKVKTPKKSKFVNMQVAPIVSETPIDVQDDPIGPMVSDGPKPAVVINLDETNSSTTELITRIMDFRTDFGNLGNSI